MALINRVSRLFTADVHAVLDRIEEPDVLLKQAVRDMEEQLAEAGRRVRHLEQERSSLSGRQVELERTAAELTEQLDVCFDSDEEQLARALIKRKLEAERLGKHLGTRLADCIAKLEAERRALEENGRRLASLREKAELMGDPANAETDFDIPFKHDFTVGDDEVEVAFLREKQRRAGS